MEGEPETSKTKLQRSKTTYIKESAVNNDLPEIIIISSYPPTECGIANYSHDLVEALNSKFENTFKLKVCAVEQEQHKLAYPKEVKYVLNTSSCKSFLSMSNIINLDPKIKIVIFQHEFGLFPNSEKQFLLFLKAIKKTKIIVFHSVLPHPDVPMKQKVKAMVSSSDAIIVMTKNAATLLENHYSVNTNKINIIAHGTHLVPLIDKNILKAKYGFFNQKILSTFGLLRSSKNIETTLDALVDIVQTDSNVLFLIIGKTHPNVLRSEGEKYREFLQEKVKKLHLKNHVKFINEYVPLEDLLEYLQLTDLYLFTSKNPNQAVSGTFSYALSCGCTIISTPIPHAIEFLDNDAGIIVDFENAQAVSEALKKLLKDASLRENMRQNSLRKIIPTAWENAAIAHGMLFEKLSNETISLHFKKPALNLTHLKKLTTYFGIIQKAKINKPEPESGYTLDDNAFALIAMCQHYEISKNKNDLDYIDIYLNFIAFCQQDNGIFLNHVTMKHEFPEPESKEIMDLSGAKAVWALGYLITKTTILPEAITVKAETIIQKALSKIENTASIPAMAYMIKGLYYYNSYEKSNAVQLLIKTLANKLTQMYLKKATIEWQWFDSTISFGDSIVPEALLYAYLETDEYIYKDIAKSAFDFLLQKTFIEISTGKKLSPFLYSEHPWDVSIMILALSKFYHYFKEELYLSKMNMAFNWFSGKNQVNQIIYNPNTGGCYEGIDNDSVNIDQGAKATISYIIAKLCIDKNSLLPKIRQRKKSKKSNVYLPGIISMV